MEAINVAEAKSRFSELISRAAAGERFVIQRRERSVAALVNLDYLEQLERSAQAARRLALALGQDIDLIEQIESSQVHPAMVGFGLWGEDASLENLTDELYQARRAAPKRSGANEP